MSRKRRIDRHPKVPQARRHSSGQARVTLSGRTIYLGRFGTAEAAAAYADAVTRWEANGRSWIERAPQTVADARAIAERVAQQHGIPLAAAERVVDVLAEFPGKLRDVEAVALAKARHPDAFVTAPTAPPVTIAVALAQFETHLDVADRYTKRGEQTTERAIVAKAIAEFVASFGSRPVTELDSAMLLAHRDALEARRSTTGDEGTERPLSRGGVNRKIQTLKRALRWLRDRRVLTREQWLDVNDVAPLRRGELGDAREAKRAKRAVTPEEVEAVARATTHVIAGMLRVQVLTGMRPGEVCAMRRQAIDKDGPEVDGVRCWVYRVENGKTAHHGHETSYVLGPAAQEILARFPSLPAAPIFKPAEHVEELRRAKREARKSEVPPAQQERDRRRSRRYRAGFSVDVYGSIVVRACERAKVATFTPHEVRHGFVTRAARQFGVMAASVAANHTNTGTTQGYLHRDRADAARVVLGLEPTPGDEPSRPRHIKATNAG